MRLTVLSHHVYTLLLNGELYRAPIGPNLEVRF